MAKYPPIPPGVEPNPRNKAKKNKVVPSIRATNKPIVNHLPIMIELNTGDDRSAAVVGAGLVENNLALAIMARLIDLTAEQQVSLFDNESSPLGTFYRKIEMGFALNLYSARIAADLKAIKHVRNRFAHHLDVRSFDHPEVAPKCTNLNAPQWLAFTSGKAASISNRERYLETVSHLAARFSLEVHNNTLRPAPARITSYDAWEPNTALRLDA